MGLLSGDNTMILWIAGIWDSKLEHWLFSLTCQLGGGGGGVLNHDMPFVGVELNGSKEGNLLENFSQASSKIRLHISEHDEGQ